MKKLTEFLNVLEEKTNLLGLCTVGFFGVGIFLFFVLIGFLTLKEKEMTSQMEFELLKHCISSTRQVDKCNEMIIDWREK